MENIKVKVLKQVRHQVKLLLLKLGVGNFARSIVVGLENKLKSGRLQKFGPLILKEVHETLLSVGVGYFVEFGTLLGIVRENGLLKHDTDMDFSLPPGDIPNGVALEALLSKGFEFYWGFEYDGVLTEFTLLRYGIHIDFFIFRKEDNGLYCNNYVDNYDSTRSKIISWTARKIHYPLLDGVKEKKVCGCCVNIPVNYDQWLTAQYGNWRIPDTKWDYISDYNQSRTEILPKNGRTVDLIRTRELLSKT